MSGRQLINAQITRNLGDRSDDKRKQAALEIESYLKELDSSSPAAADRVKLVISQLVSDYLLSWQPNFRKGGLVGLSAVAISLLDSAGVHLHKLLPPILRCTLDTDARVRYYACEALYNVAKVARGHLLIYFNEMFDALCKLHADPDADVRSAAQLLDRLTKDIVTESAAFDVEYFIPLLRERTRLRSPFVRQLILGWVLLLDSLPDIDILEFLPELLPGIFDMLSDPNKDIRQYAYSTLTQLLRQIAFAPRVDLGSMVPLLAAQAAHRDPFRRLTVIVWLCEFAHVGKGSILPHLPSLLTVAMGGMGDLAREIRAKAQALNNTLLRLTIETSADVDLASVVPTVLSQLGSTWVPARLASLRWVAVLTALHPESVFSHLHAIFPVLLAALQDPDEQVVRLTLEAVARLALDADGRVNTESSHAVFRNLLRLFASDVDLLEARGGLIIRQLSLLLGVEEVFVRITDNLKNNSEVEFTALMSQTLSLLLLTSAEAQPLRAKLRDHAFSRPIGSVPFRETKSGKKALMFGLIGSGSRAAAAASTGNSATGKVGSKGVGSARVAAFLNQADAAAITSSDSTVNGAANSGGDVGASSPSASGESLTARGLFTTFFTTWCHSPVAALTLCFLSRAYSIANFVITEMAASEMTVGSLLQLDRLVQLLESPVLAHVRVDLVNGAMKLHHTLRMILSLLPQSAAFNALATRLNHLPEVKTDDFSAAYSFLQNELRELDVETRSRIDKFRLPPREHEHGTQKACFEAYWEAQEEHAARRRRVAAFSSLLADDGSESDDDDDLDVGDDDGDRLSISDRVDAEQADATGDEGLATGGAGSGATVADDDAGVEDDKQRV